MKERVNSLEHKEGRLEQLNELSERVNQLEATLTTDITELGTKVGTNETNITTLQAQIAEINAAIEGGGGGSISTINQIVGLRAELDKKAEYNVTEW